MPERLGTAELSRSIFNPYPGLRPFEPEESYLYFGRETQTDELMRRLGDTHFLSVVGTSGSGKSSLVRAGLVPALHSGYMTDAGSSWRVAILRPGGAPIANLAKALAGVLERSDAADADADQADADASGAGQTDDTDAASIIETTLRGSSLGLFESVEIARIPEHDNVLVVVDQFEELFRYKQRAASSEVRDEAVAFVKLLLAAAAESKRLYVVITMRSDFIGDCMEFPRLPEAINEGQYLVPRMTRDELRRAITGPAGVRHAEISPRLVARLLNDVGDNPDQLPVLQHALMRMWTRWEGEGRAGKLDAPHYEAIGTMTEALSRHAEKAYGELETDRQREIAERLWKALTETEAGGRGIRRPARLGEVCEIAGAELAEVVRVIDRFRLEGRSFLMPPISKKLTESSILDLSHESLMRNWERLKAWTAEEAEHAKTYRRLARAARRHQAGEGGLWRAPELDLGLRWREEVRPTAAWARRYDPKFERAIAFLDESARAREEYDKRRELARRRKLQASVAFAATVVLLLAGFLWYVDKERNRQRAFSVSLAGDDPLLRAQVLSAVSEPLDVRIGRLFGKSEKNTGGLGFEALRRAAYDPIPRAVFRVPASPGEDRPPITATAVSPDGARVVTGAADGRAWIWSSDGRGDPRALVAGASDQAHGAAVTTVAFDPGGTRFVSAGDDGTVRIWTTGGELSADLVGHEGRVETASFSPDGRYLVTASKDSTARIWHPDGRQAAVLEHHQRVNSASFDPEGKRVVTASDIGMARIWTLEGEKLASIRLYDRPVSGAWFTPDGLGVLLAWRGTEAVQIFSTSGERRQLFVNHSQPVKGASFGPKGSILTFSADARIWSAESGEEKAVLKRPGRVTDAAFTADGRYVVTGSSDGTARIWSADGDELRSLDGHFGAVNVLALPGPASRTASGPPAASIVVTAAEDGTARVWPLEVGEPRRLSRHGERVTGLAVHPRVAKAGAPLVAVSTSDDGTAWVWSFDGGDSGGDEIAELVAEGVSLTSASFSPRGDEIAAGGDDGKVRIWRREGTAWSERPVVFEAHGQAVTGVSYHPRDGDEMVTTSADATARIWKRDAGGWSELQAITEHGSKVMSATFDAAGDRILTTSFDGLAILWRKNPAGEWILESPLGNGDLGTLRTASISPRGDRIVTASTDAVWIWRPAADGQWRHARELQGHRGYVYDASFSPRGREVVTASEDGTARVWNAETGNSLYVLEVGEAVWTARLDPGGSHLLTGSASGSVLLWRVSERDLRQYLQTSSSACLTVEQRCLFLDQRQWKARSRFVACEEEHGRTPPAVLPSCP